jgi:hypothetical protein
VVATINGRADMMAATGKGNPIPVDTNIERVGLSTARLSLRRIRGNHPLQVTRALGWDCLRLLRHM